MGLAALDSVKVVGEESCAIVECWKVLPLWLCSLRSSPQRCPLVVEGLGEGWQSEARRNEKPSGPASGGRGGG